MVAAGSSGRRAAAALARACSGERAPGDDGGDAGLLHHAYIDKLWTEWQRRHPRSGYLPTGGTPDVVDLNETLRPWHDMTPADLLDHTPHYTYDA
ncbi:hypothetical protein GCM10009601_26590 [Streptomyces thermospinosisporus]|uniref:Uncharacterized protein n=1 Tax=Streptomyces thermospinosisporus TaxID=161482 RepID=A0ABP4JLY2_9ACTN